MLRFVDRFLGSIFWALFDLGVFILAGVFRFLNYLFGFFEPDDGHDSF